jgi:hypothetical protein
VRAVTLPEQGPSAARDKGIITEAAARSPTVIAVGERIVIAGLDKWVKTKEERSARGVV